MTTRKERVDEWLNGRDPIQLSPIEIEAMRAEGLICGYLRPSANYRPCMRPPRVNPEPSDRCKTHDRKGNAPKGPDHPNFKHGLYAESFKGELKKKFVQNVGVADPLDVLPEIAAMRTLFQEYVSRFEHNQKVSRDDIHALTTWADRIVRAVTQAIRVRNESALTIAEIQFLRVGLTAAINDFIPDPERRAEFIDRVAELIPFGTETGNNGHGEPGELPG